MNVLVMSHAHPDLSAGGAERAAYSLFDHLKVAPGIGQVSFVARAMPESIGHSAPIGAFRGRPDELLACPPPLDPFTQSTTDYTRLEEIVRAVMTRFEPDVVHVHHFAFWGVELFELLKRHGARVIFTMHEFIPICHRQGQMLKTNGRLCATSSPAECSACFPNHTPGQFFLREKVFKAFMAHVDHFISPSKFLADRFVAWGLPADKVSAIENPLARDVLATAATLRARARDAALPARAPEVGDESSRRESTRSERVLEPELAGAAGGRGFGERRGGGGAAEPPDDLRRIIGRREADGGGMVRYRPRQPTQRTRIGFFGQVNPYKGIDVLLEAIGLLEDEDRLRLSVGLHGANLDMQEPWFREKIERLMEPVRDVVSFRGPYQNDRVLDLMAQYDWIIVPSIWWENSPVVIQEALAIGKPVLCSRIGGMAEKVDDGVTGAYFEAGSPSDLAMKLMGLGSRNVNSHAPATATAGAALSAVIEQYLQ
jgi:glycosyltransferase involved in cell wall biosynthesis